jgi:hypothetical protein
VTSIILPYFGDSYREVRSEYLSLLYSFVIRRWLDSDTFQLVAEGLVVITFTRNGIATAVSFAINPWMTGLGVQNMFICAGCLCFAIMLLVIPMILWGRKARSSTADFYVNIVAGG